MRQFDPSQQQAALVAIERMAWGDMDSAIRDLELCLRRALEATAEDFVRWENDLALRFEEDGFDEFNLPRSSIEEMPPEERLSYVARLLRSLALHYGVSAEIGGGRGGLVDEESAASPAGLLRSLNEISWMPVQNKSTSGRSPGLRS
jgi:hypothetical protein